MGEYLGLENVDPHGFCGVKPRGWDDSDPSVSNPKLFGQFSCLTRNVSVGRGEWGKG